MKGFLTRLRTFEPVDWLWATAAILFAIGIIGLAISGVAALINLI